MDLSITFDIAIVGGGISGTSLAYWLTRLYPSQRCILIEERELAGGATGANGRQMWPLQRPSVSEMLAEFEVQCQEELIMLMNNHGDEGLAECRFSREGSYYFAQTKEEEAAIRNRVAANPQVTELLSREECCRITGSTSFRSGVLDKRGGQVHSPSLVKMIAKAASSIPSRLQIVEHTKVDRLCLQEANGQEGSCVRLVTSNGNVYATRCIVACNGKTRNLLPSLRNIITPVRAQVLETDVVPPILRHPVQMGFGPRCAEYLVQQPNGKIVFGGCRMASQTQEVDCEDDSTINPKVSIALRKRLFDYLPILLKHDVTINKEWTGIMGFSADGLPVVGPLTAAQCPFSTKNHDTPVAVIGGFNGHGMTVCFLAARSLAIRLMEGDDKWPIVDKWASLCSTWSPSRWEKKAAAKL